MLNVNYLLHVQVGVWIVAVRTSDSVPGMGRRMPGHGRRVVVVALEAEVGASLRSDLAVGIVARRAIESDRAADLMRCGNVLLLGHVRVATEADVWRDRAHVVGLCADRGHVDLRFFIHTRKSYQADGSVGLAVLSDGRGWRAGGHVVVRRVAVRARYAVRGMGRRSPLRSRRTRILFVTLEAQFGALGRGEFLEAQDCSRLLTAGLQMTARRTVTLLARLIAMHVVLKGLHIGFVTRHAETVVVDVLGLSNLAEPARATPRFSLPAREVRGRARTAQDRSWSGHGVPTWAAEPGKRWR